jgi:hypothetical protein
MDTRRLSEPIEAAARPIAADAAPVVEIVELTALAKPRRATVPRVIFVVGVAILAGLIAIAGAPTRTSFALDQPLPNLFAAPQTP